MTDRPVARALALLALAACVAPSADAQWKFERRREDGGDILENRAYAASPHQLWPAVLASRDGMVVSGAGDASRVGAAILASGGNAVDAAVAAAFALGVVEPTTSGLGGETLILVVLADGRTVAIDGSCYVPMAARPDELQAERNAAPRSYVLGYRSVAVPGALAALAHALSKYGTKSLADVLAPAIELAEFGFRMNVTELANVENYADKLLAQDRVAAMFLDEFARPFDLHHVYCPAELAGTLRRIAARGPEEFYRGAIAAEIEADMERRGGYVRRADLARVRAVERQPVRGAYRGVEVISFPYPGGGGALVETLNILETFPQATLRAPSLDRIHLLIEAARIAAADASASNWPVELLDRRLVDKSWAAGRARQIRFDRALRPAEISREAGDSHLAIGTTQVSVVDRWGNIVALTQTVGASFGSGVETPGLGFLWNSNLNAFDFASPSSPHRLAPGRAVGTSMAPTVLVRDGKPFLVLGSAGSNRVVPTVAAVVTGVVDRGLGLCEAVAAPRAIWGGNYGGERPWVELAGEITPELAAALEARGFRALEKQKFPAHPMDLMLFGGTNAISVDPETGVAVGVGDPRRLGVPAAPHAPR